MSPPPDFRTARSFTDITRHWAHIGRDDTAVVFVDFDPDTESTLTYGELDRRARAIAALLRERGAAPGDRALLVYAPGLDYVTGFFGCLYAGVVAVPAYPPDPTRLERTLPRLRAIVADASPRIVLTQGVLAEVAQSLFEDAPELRDLSWLATDGTLEDSTSGPPELSPESLAFLQYTSGSTGTPKGVRLTHGNLLHNCELIRNNFGHTRRSRAIIWLPPYHDMGLIGGILQPVYAGFPTVLMSPLSFLAKPLRWLKTISKYRGTVSGGPSFAFDLCVRKVNADERDSLDLSSWELAFNGAEPVRAGVIERFTETFAPCGFQPETFHPVYGLAEATLLVSGGDKGRRPTLSSFRAEALEHQRAEPAGAGEAASCLVGCGRTLGDQEIIIVDPASLRPLPEGEIGEVWLHGGSVADGYWNRPDESAATFGAKLAGAPATRTFLRTGDLGFLHQEELFIAGRRKDLIILRGRNHYPQDIEASVERCHPALRPGCGAAFSIEEGGEELLVIAWEVNARLLSKQAPEAALEELMSTMRVEVSRVHEVAVHAIALLSPGGIPKTSSGKIQRHACRLGWMTDELPFLHSRTWSATTEEAPEPQGLLEANPPVVDRVLRGVLSRMLGLRPEEIDSSAPMSRLGLDSLKSVEVAHALWQTFGAEVRPTQFLKEQPLSSVIDEICLAAGHRATPAAPGTSEGTEWPLSEGQAAMWFLQQLRPQSPTYNLWIALQVLGSIDESWLRAALERLVARHPALRTVYFALDGQPRQMVIPDAALDLEFIPVGDCDDGTLQARIAHEARRPFELSRGAFRVQVFTRPQGASVILLAMHHIAVDLASATELWMDLASDRSPEASGAYLDFVREQQALLAGPRGAALEAWWAEQLRLPAERPTLPTDHPRGARRREAGAKHTFRFPADLTVRLKAIAREEGSTLFAVLLSAFEVLLGRLGGQRDFSLLTTVSGRSRASFQRTVGNFVNQLVLQADLSGDPSFRALVARTRRQVLDALDHQDYPFPRAVQKFLSERAPQASPFSDVMFVLDHTAEALEDVVLAALGGQGRARPLPLGPMRVVPWFGIERESIEFDLVAWLLEVGDQGLTGAFEYSTELFDSETIERFARSFEELLRSICADADRPLSQLAMVPTSDLELLLREWGTQRQDLPLERCLHEWIADQAARTPRRPALVHAGRVLSYAEVEARSTALAVRLYETGVQRGDRVALFLERSTELVLAALAVMKAGAAYLPIDPADPAERVALVLADAGARLVLTHAPTHAALPPGTRALQLERDGEGLLAWNRLEGMSRPGPDDAAYIIYTSGTTGQPKGVVVPHRGVCNRLLWMQAAYGLSEEDVVLQKTPATFDVSVWELFWPLMYGAALVITRPGEHRDPLALAALIREHRVTTVHFVPSMLDAFLSAGAAEGCSSLERVFCSGEALPPELRDRFFQASHATLYNLYGPTEASIDATHWTCARDDRRHSVPIGRPIANMRAYVLDERLALVPVGAPGELYLSGVGLATAYLGHPALTAERFVPDPFSGVPGERMYQTGDLARWSRHGELEYLGRSDDQVKVRGFRVEPGEVEAALARHPRVGRAVVVRQGVGAEARLVAYVVPDGAPEALAAELRAHLEQLLPAHMIPGAFVFVDAFPTTSSGKVDRRRLPAPGPERPELATSFVAPRTPEEEELAAHWRELLGIERVGIHDDFFTLGGHSLLLMQLASRLRASFGVELPLGSLFDAPTITGMADLIARTYIEQLGEEELEALQAEFAPPRRASGT